MSRARAIAAGCLAVACTGQAGDTLSHARPVAPGASDPTAPTRYAEPAGDVLSFFIQEGAIRNSFHRRGPVATHILTRSGTEPRLIAAFPANNQGIGVWFGSAPQATTLWVSDESGQADATRAGRLTALVRESGERDLLGVRARLRSDARTLRAELILLGNLRTLRDYGYGLCLEDAASFPSLRNETFDVIETHRVVRVRREQVTPGSSMELLIRARQNTTLSVVEHALTLRPGCGTNAGAQRVRTMLEISGPDGVDFEVIALSNEPPLIPIEKADLLSRPVPHSRELDALAFLSYQEKLLAGSWRFLTYFGRDTLLSVRMLMPVLKNAVIEAALGAVLDRVNLQPAARDELGFVIERGDVAHEEEIGDYAAFRNLASGLAPQALGAPRYDYKMVDDDFLLAPILAEFVKRFAAEGGPAAAQLLNTFLTRKRPDGQTFRTALEANLDLVLARARPFANDPRAPRHKKHLLVALAPDVSVGQWRDSEMGLGFGRYPFDVNAALVPAALEAAAVLYRHLRCPECATEAERLLGAWKGVAELFRVELPLAKAQSHVRDYAGSLGLADTSASLQASNDGSYSYYGIALDRQHKPVPVLHSDHGFVLEFTHPSDEYLVRAVNSMRAEYPAGLLSPVGLMVANPALAAPEFSVTNRQQGHTTIDDHPIPLRALYTNSHYHGTVVWSWQQALLASGLRRQIQRTDIADQTRRVLQQTECALWQVIEASSRIRAGELWSFRVNTVGRPEHRPFGVSRADATESNAIQLWSTVYLAIRAPSNRENPLCTKDSP